MKERPAPHGQENPAEKASVTPGMAALLSGGNGHTKNQPAPADAQNLATAVRKRKLIQASLFIADILLIGLVARLVFVSHGHFGLVEVALCILAMAIGAWLSCLALWMK